MKTVLGFNIEKLKGLKAINTAVEINQQPDIWIEAYRNLKDKRREIKMFMDEVLQVPNLNIILTGAGSSAFVGECAKSYLKDNIDVRVDAIATTDIVSYPKKYFRKKTPTLLISCARSGNSPESIGAAKLAEEEIEELYQIVLTCDPEGQLAKTISQDKNKLVIIMPDASNDKGFAMTGSFSCMLLSLFLIFEIDQLEKYEASLETMVSAVKKALSVDREAIKKLAEEEISRVVYLGASGMQSLAKESALKMLELTAGEVTTLYDSPLGFRHGPKSYIDKNTLVIVYLSNDAYARQYEIDLLKEIKNDNVAKILCSISDYEDDIAANYSHIALSLGKQRSNYYNDIFLALSYLLHAQLFAFYKSINLGIAPDNPSPSGHVNRVVKGVKIYAFHGEA